MEIGEILTPSQPMKRTFRIKHNSVVVLFVSRKKRMHDLVITTQIRPDYLFWDIRWFDET